MRACSSVPSLLYLGAAGLLVMIILVSLFPVTAGIPFYELAGTNFLLSGESASNSSANGTAGNVTSSPSAAVQWSWPLHPDQLPINLPVYAVSFSVILMSLPPGQGRGFHLMVSVCDLPLPRCLMLGGLC